jgi:hypothetical protein
MDPKTKMRIRLAVSDYQRMFPEGYSLLLLEVKRQRDNLKNQFAGLDKTAMVQRGLFVISEELSVMIGKKLSPREMELFKEKENARWFAKEFPQFALTKV